MRAKIIIVDVKDIDANIDFFLMRAYCLFLKYNSWFIEYKTSSLTIVLNISRQDSFSSSLMYNKNNINLVNAVDGEECEAYFSVNNSL